MNETPTARHHLEDQSRLWEGAFTHSSLGMVIVDPVKLRLLAANPAYQRLSGYSAAELLGRDVFSLYPESERTHLCETSKQAAIDGTSSTVIRRLRKDGTLMPTRLELVVVRDANGELQFAVGTVTDLSEQERTQAQLHHQESQRLVDQHFRHLAHSAPIGIVLANIDGSITFANPAWLAITAVTLEQAIDSDWFDLVHPDDRDRVTAAWLRTRDGGADFDLEFRYRRPSGEVRWVQARATELKDTDGTRVGYVRTCLDVTERLLERAATDRFHSQVRSLAQRLQQMRGVERAELAGSLQEGVYQGLAQVKAELESLAHGGVAGISDHGAFTRLTAIAESTLEGLRRVMFDLTPPGIEELGFAGAMARYVDEQAARSGVAITLRMPDPVAIHQETLSVFYAAAQEAVANALEHSQPTRVEVLVEVQNGLARLRVNDNGVGMGDKDRNRPGCFGLLAIAERLAQIGGTLRTLGAAGQGTRFEASVPVRSRHRHRPSD